VPVKASHRKGRMGVSLYNTIESQKFLRCCFAIKSLLYAAGCSRVCSKMVCMEKMKQVLNVIWRKAASPPHTEGSVVLIRWCQCAPRAPNAYLPEPTRVHNPNCISIGSGVFAGLMIVTDRPTDHATRSVTIGRMYVSIVRRCGLIWRKTATLKDGSHYTRRRRACPQHSAQTNRTRSKQWRRVHTVSPVLTTTQRSASQSVWTALEFYSHSSVYSTDIRSFEIGWLGFLSAPKQSSAHLGANFNLINERSK